MRSALLLAGLLLIAGCGKSAHRELRPVTGTVTWKNAKLTHAVITFVPMGDTKGGGASGRTDEEGKYELTDVRGGSGVLPGEYRVLISKRVRADGSVETEHVGAEDSTAKEILPERYSHPEKTELTTKVPAAGGPIDFRLK